MKKNAAPFSLSRREFMVACAATPALAPYVMNTSQTPPQSDLKLWYDKPAGAWTEALPVGNGKVAAMVFGRVAEERLALNVADLWAGGPHDYVNPEAKEALPEVQRLVLEGKYQEATDLANAKLVGRPAGQAPYQTLGDMLIEFDLEGEPSEYRRELDLDEAVATTTFTVGGVTYTREVIATHSADLMAVRLTAPEKGRLSFSVRFASPQQSTVSVKGLTLKLAGTSGDHAGIPGAVKFVGLAQVETDGGSVSGESDRLRVKDADSATIYFSAATNYITFDDLSGDPEALAQKPLATRQGQDYDAIKRAHVRDHQRLFRRVEIDLGPSSPEPTDARIRAFRESNDPGLATLYYQYGRYLLIACSRPGGQTGTLQGLWNESMNPPWGSKYTININIEMNYWPAEPCGLSECHEPLFAMLEELSRSGAKTAQTMYGAKGWLAHHNTDGWRGSAPVDGAFWGMWQTGGAWLCTHMWERYLFTGDKEGLAKHFPIMKGAAEFFLDAMVDLPGTDYRVTCPSNSPENAHHPGVSICAGPTMDNQIIRHLLTACISAAEVLDTDADFAAQAKEVLAKIPPDQIGEAGQLQEWFEDWDVKAPEQRHRHVSHLYGLFPSPEITVDGTPDLAAAAKKTLEMRGDDGTGWSLAWKINFWARLLDGDHAYKLVQNALNPAERGGSGVYPNLFDAHPPFQIDGNFGFTSGVTEMLLQSHNETLHLLPSLPSAWPKGSVKGLRARGGYIVDLAWEDMKLTKATIRSTWGEDVLVKYQGKSILHEFSKGQSRTGDAAYWTGDS